MAILLGFASLSLFLFWLLHRRFSHRSLPPGPKPLPLVGNLHQVPPKDPWRQFKKWNDEYGPLITLHMGPKTVICVGSHHVAQDLLNKRQNIYSSRPRMVYMGECVFKGLNTGLLPYGAQWRTHNRIQTKCLRPGWVSQYGPVQDLETKQMLQELLVTSDFEAVALRLSYSVNSTMAYGRRVETAESPVMKNMARISRHIAETGASSLGMLVEHVPALNRLPQWIAPWKKKSEQAHQQVFGLYMNNFRDGKASKTWNWTNAALDFEEAKGVSEAELANIIGFIFDAGSEPISATLRMFILAAVTNPVAIRKAQDEIDRVVGSTRLPSREDVANLPYTRALLTETMRWRPAIPAGFPHEVTQDDEYMGYRIPRGATIIPNNWSLDLDATIFERPLEFCPERWLENPDLPLGTFGFARRRCPGQSLARDVLHLAISRLLWGYSISVADQDREPDTLNLEQGLIGPPVPFGVVFKPRSEQHRRTIVQEWQATEKDPTVLMTQIGCQIQASAAPKAIPDEQFFTGCEKHV